MLVLEKVVGWVERSMFQVVPLVGCHQSARAKRGAERVVSRGIAREREVLMLVLCVMNVRRGTATQGLGRETVAAEGVSWEADESRCF